MTSSGTLATASHLELAIRRTKVACFQARRLLDWAASPGRWRVPALAPSAAGFPHAIYQDERAIARCDAGVDPVLDQGKQINLALAAPHFDGLVLAPGQTLSFWRTLGRVTAARGFRHGMELRGGCIVPTIGGGLCALSNALFQMACALGWTIVERHGHTREAAPSDGPVWGLDATVLWPHVDLRIAPRRGPVRLGVTVAHGMLRIRVDSAVAARVQVSLESVDDRIVTAGVPGAAAAVPTGAIAGAVAGQPRFRSNRVLRTIVDHTDGQPAPALREVVASNHRQLLRPVEQRRSCLTCGDAACRARPRDLPGPSTPLPPELP